MSVQNIAPFVAGPLTLPSTLEVVGALTADSKVEVKGAATCDSSLEVKGATTCDSTIVVKGITTLDSLATTPITTNGGGSINAYNFYSFGGGLIMNGSGPVIVSRVNGAGPQTIFQFPQPSANVQINASDPGTTPVNLIYSGSGAGQSITGGLTLDSLTLTSTLQFSIGAGALQSIAFTLSTSDISTLASVGKSLLSAPGAGNLIVPTHFIMEYIYDGSHPISGGGSGSIVLCYNANSLNAASAGVADAFVQTSQNQVAVPTMTFNTSAVNVLPSSSCVNQALWIRKTNSDFAMNSSTATIRGRLWYITHTGL